MFRSAAGWVLATILAASATPAAAEERQKTLLTRSTMMAHTVATNGSVPAEPHLRRPSSRALVALSGTYGVLQGVDMYSTMVARKRGAREVNPLLDAFIDAGYPQATAWKGVMTAGTIFGIKSMEKKSRKAAVITAVGLNAISAVVVANNFRHARQLHASR